MTFIRLYLIIQDRALITILIIKRYGEYGWKPVYDVNDDAAADDDAVGWNADGLLSIDDPDAADDDGSMQLSP